MTGGRTPLPVDVGCDKLSVFEARESRLALGARDDWRAASRANYVAKPSSYRLSASSGHRKMRLQEAL
jgi:hypothetical protein